MSRVGTIIDRRNWNAEEQWFEQGLARAFWDKNTKHWIVYRIDGVTKYQVGNARLYPNSYSLIHDQDAINHLGSPTNWEDYAEGWL